MIIKKAVLGPYQENTYILMDEDTRETILIDPGDEAEEIIGYLRQLRAELKYILLTHGHVDHVGAVDAVRDAFHVPAFIAEEDMMAIEKRKMAFGRMRPAEGFLKEGDKLMFGRRKVTIYATPGHSKGSLSYLIEGNLFVGDVLFQNSIGRTDLYGGDFHELISSIKDKLMTLPEGTRVYPGHGLETTLGIEKAFNAYLK